MPYESAPAGTIETDDEIEARLAAQEQYLPEGTDPIELRRRQKVEARAEDATIALYRDIERSAEGHDVLQRLLTQVRECAVRYAITVNRWVKAKAERMESSEIAEMDVGRRYSHDALIDSLNILARSCRTNGKDTSWRERLGDDRGIITSWALTVNDLIAQQFETASATS